MIRVLRIEEEDGRRVIFDGHPEIELLEGETSPFLPGEELSQEEFYQKMLAFSEKVILEGAQILARRPLSMSMFLKKLRERGIPSSRADFIAEFFLRSGLLDDKDYALLLAESFSEKGKGRYALKRELALRGIPEEAALAAMEALIPPEEAISNFLLKKVRERPVSEKEYRRLFQALLRRGFQSDDIRAALKPYRDAEEEFDD